MKQIYLNVSRTCKIVSLMRKYGILRMALNFVDTKNNNYSKSIEDGMEETQIHSNYNSYLG